MAQARTATDGNTAEFTTVNTGENRMMTYCVSEAEDLSVPNTEDGVVQDDPYPASGKGTYQANRGEDPGTQVTVGPRDKLGSNPGMQYVDSTLCTSLALGIVSGDEGGAASEDRENMLLFSEDQLNPSGFGLPCHTSDNVTAEQEDGSAVETHVRLVQTVRVPPHQSVAAEVSLEVGGPWNAPMLFVSHELSESQTGLSSEDAILQPLGDNRSHILISNFTGYTQYLEGGDIVGHVEEVDIVDTQLADSTHDSDSNAFIVRSSTGLGEHGGWDRQRKQKLRDVLVPPDLPTQEREKLMDFLITYHHVFSLENGERGETDIVQMEIDTGDSYPKRQAPRQMPFAVREEVARQLNEMQESGVIRPSKSPWASPVVLVRKRDGTHRFCVDYRALNSVTKSDSFPLPRIDELLDQLGKAKYFSTIDLASGFWQIRMHPMSQEKTAFITHQGLYEFKVMPFGLTNAPAVFQRLMEQVIAPLRVAPGPEYVSAYLDDVLVFSRTLEDHLTHLRAIIQRIDKVGLKLKPAKCKFAQKELEYLGHIVSRDGLKTNPRLVAAVKEFPTPRAVSDVRRYLGLASYYQRFIPNFSRIARPLHQLTCKGAEFVWSPECERVFRELKERLTTSPMLAYPDFSRAFILETDASVQGIGAVLSQRQEDQRLHPIAYASRALSPVEQRYSITELETLAVVWAISHFHHYLYGNSVTIFTDHTAVKAVLETANPTAKHARWWTRVYGRGVKDVKIVYRPGRENSNADALSRHPLLPAPTIGIAEDEMQVSRIDCPERMDKVSHAVPLRAAQSLSSTSCPTPMGREESLSQCLIATRAPSAALSSDQAAVPHVCTSDEQGQGLRDDTIRLHLGPELEQAFPRESPQGDDPPLTEVSEGPRRSLTAVFTGHESCSKFHVSPRQALTFTVCSSLPREQQELLTPLPNCLRWAAMERL